MNVARGLTLRHDHGSEYRSETFQSELELLGIASSPAFVGVGGGCAERVIGTLNESLFWVCNFPSVEELNIALLAMAEIYNGE